LVKAGKISSLEEIFLHSIPVKESQIIDYFLKDLKVSQRLRIVL
jgi:small subunit ribosomal protein S2e